MVAGDQSHNQFNDQWRVGDLTTEAGIQFGEEGGFKEIGTEAVGTA